MSDTNNKLRILSNEDLYYEIKRYDVLCQQEFDSNGETDKLEKMVLNQREFIREHLRRNKTD